MKNTTETTTPIFKSNVNSVEAEASIRAYVEFLRNTNTPEARFKYNQIAVEWPRQQNMSEEKLTDINEWRSGDFLALYSFIAENHFKNKITVSGPRTEVAKINFHLDECPVKMHTENGILVFASNDSAAFALRWLHTKLSTEYLGNDSIFIPNDSITYGEAKAELIN